MNSYIVEITDTFGREANYSWIRRYVVSANSLRGAVNKIAREYGAGWKIYENYGTDSARYNLTNACVCMFVEYVDEQDKQSYLDNHGWIKQI